VLVYSVDASVRSGYGPVQVMPAQRDINADLHNSCGPLYNAPFDKAKGEVARFESPSAGLSMQVLSSGASGYRVHVTRTSMSSQSFEPMSTFGGGEAGPGSIQEGTPAPPLLPDAFPFGTGWGLSGPPAAD
jgi:hypothetical protein